MVPDAPHPSAGAIATREALRAQGLTQAEFARRIGCHQPDVSAYLTGRVIPSVATLAVIAATLGRPDLERASLWLAPAGEGAA